MNARGSGTSESALATACLVVGLSCVAFALTWQLTLGFRAWTTEDARRLRVVTDTLSISPLTVTTAQAATQTLLAPGGSPKEVYLLHFMYTRCPSVCRALGSEFAQLQSALQADPAKAVRLYSISFDIAHDTPEQLARYAKANQADATYWTVAAPGDEASLARLLDEAGVVVIPDGSGGYAHNAALHVVLGSGQLVRIFDYDQHQEALAFARTLAQ